jgi:hypothetical protein
MGHMILKISVLMLIMLISWEVLVLSYGQHSDQIKCGF